MDDSTIYGIGITGLALFLLVIFAVLFKLAGA